MNNGGYVMVDCGGLNFLAESPQTITGLYEACKEAYRTGKQVLAVNTKWGTTPCSPISVLMIPFDDGVIRCSACTLRIDVAENDSVTIVNYITE